MIEFEQLFSCFEYQATSNTLNTDNSDSLK